MASRRPKGIVLYRGEPKEVRGFVVKLSKEICIGCKSVESDFFLDQSAYEMHVEPLVCADLFCCAFSSRECIDCGKKEKGGAYAVSVAYRLRSV